MRYIYPNSTVSNSGYTVHNAATAHEAVSQLGPGVPYVESRTSPGSGSASIVFGLPAQVDPGTDSGVSIRLWIQQLGTGGTFDAKVYEGATLRFTSATTDLVVGVAPSYAAKLYVLTIDSVSWSAITDFSALRIGVEVAHGPGFNRIYSASLLFPDNFAGSLNLTAVPAGDASLAINFAGTIALTAVPAGSALLNLAITPTVLSPAGETGVSTSRILQFAMLPTTETIVAVRWYVSTTSAIAPPLGDVYDTLWREPDGSVLTTDTFDFDPSLPRNGRGLLPSTLYYVSARRRLSDGSESQAATAVTFTTRAAPVASAGWRQAQA